MITRITKENRAKYALLFAEATKALENEASNLEKGEIISSLEQYFENIEFLFELNPKFVRLPLDEEMFEIDLNTRQINIPAGHKKSGLAVQGDDLAEVIYFKCDRYFDATDLSQTFIMIQWEAPNGNKMASPAYYLDVDSEPGKLIFGWAVTREMTSLPGTFKFSVSFVDGEVITEENGDEVLSIDSLEYRLGTLSASININPGLSLAAQGKIMFEDRLSDLRKRIANSPIFGVDEPGVSSFIEMLAEKRLNAADGWKWEEKEYEFGNIFESLVNDTKTDGITETALTALAVPEVAGRISYAWYKMNEEDPEKDILLLNKASSTTYLPVVDTEPQYGDDFSMYYIREGLEVYRPYDPNKDLWIESKPQIVGGEVKFIENVNEDLYEKVAFLALPAHIGESEIPVPGKYYIVVSNKEGRKAETIYNSKETGGIAYIPAPTEIDGVVITAYDVNNKVNNIYDPENPNTLKSAVTLVDPQSKYYNFKYQWFRDGEAIEGADKDTYLVDKVGDYHLAVYNSWNKAVSETILSGIAQLYEIAIAPVIKKFFATSLLEGSVFGDLKTTDLEVEYEEIKQDHSTQFVYWLHDTDDADNEWAYLGKDGKPLSRADGTSIPFEELDPSQLLEGTKITPQIPGYYRVEIHNIITEDNKISTILSEEDAIKVTYFGGKDE